MIYYVYYFSDKIGEVTIPEALFAEDGCAAEYDALMEAEATFPRYKGVGLHVCSLKAVEDGPQKP